MRYPHPPSRDASNPNSTLQIPHFCATNLESESFLACAEGAEVLGRLRDDIGVEQELNASGNLAANGNVEKNLKKEMSKLTILSSVRVMRANVVKGWHATINTILIFATF